MAKIRHEVVEAGLTKLLKLSNPTQLYVFDDAQVGPVKAIISEGSAIIAEVKTSFGTRAVALLPRLLECNSSSNCEG